MAKIQIRKSVFETNSSSTHSIVIGNNGEDFKKSLPVEVEFVGGCYGWDYDHLSDISSKASYLFTGIVANSDVVDMFKCIKFIRETLKKYGVKAKFADLKVVFDGWKGEPYYDFLGEYCYVDHANELKTFIEEVCSDEELLMNYLFSDGSEIATGNDNSDDAVVCHMPKNVIAEYYKDN